jgi:signal transduction histidine kinase
MRQNPEIYFVIIIGIIIGLVLVGFVVTMLFLYKQRQHQQEQEMEKVKKMYENEVLRSQLEIQENTFKTISQELHDNIGQLLSVVKLSLSALPLEKEHKAHQLVQHSQQVLNKAIVDLSNLTKSLYTDRIADLGLTDCIRYELHSLNNSGLIQVQFSATGNEFQLIEQKAIFLFRMFQEMLNNVLKHSKATSVIVGLTYLPDKSFEMHMEDNGIGFDVQGKKLSQISSKGVGLKSMFNRAKLIGADIDISSQLNKGTCIIVKLLPQTEE